MQGLLPISFTPIVVSYVFSLQILLGDSLVFVGGILSLHFLAGMPFDKALAVGVIPFIIPDLAKIVAISFISRPLLQRLRTQPYFQANKKGRDFPCLFGSS